MHPFVSEYPDFYALFLPRIAHRARALELLVCLAIDGDSTCIEWLDEYIAELRKVLQTAAVEVPDKVARMLKRAALTIRAARRRRWAALRGTLWASVS